MEIFFKVMKTKLFKIQNIFLKYILIVTNASNAEVNRMKDVGTSLVVQWFSSVQFSCSVVSNSATPCTAAHRPPYPSPTPGVHPNPCPSSR